MKELLEIRLDPKKVPGEIEFWALYATSFYEKLFGKINDPLEVEKTYMAFKNDPRLKPRDRRAFRFFYELRMDELEEGEDNFWKMTGMSHANENNKVMKAKKINEILNEHNYTQQFNDEAYEIAKEKARKISRVEGVVQHVNEIRPGVYKVEDWYDEDTTVASFENGVEF